MSKQRSILIVEDEPLIAMMLEDFLESLGHKVAATCDTQEEALAQVERGGFDLAIIDVQLRDGKTIWPVADALAKQDIPFIVATGGHVEPPPTAHADAPILAKPYTIDSLRPALAEALAG